MNRIPALALVLALLASATLARPHAAPPANLASMAAAQVAGTHSVALSWSAGGDGTTATTYHIYRALGACANGVAPSTLPTLSFVRLDPPNSAQSATNYTDATVGVGAFCYYVTANLNASESNPSLTAGAAVKPLSPGPPTAVAN